MTARVLPFLRPSRTPRRGLNFKRSEARDFPTQRPLDIVLLAVDVASTSGTARYTRGKLHDFGELEIDADEHRHVLMRSTVELAGQLGLPLALALEIPYGGPISSVVRLREHVAVWRAAWRYSGGPAHHVIEYTAAEWRARCFGLGTLKREDARRLELRAAYGLLERARLAHTLLTPDAAAAICIGHVASTSGILYARTKCRITNP
jgi:hypothetical protein